MFKKIALAVAALLIIAAGSLVIWAAVYPEFKNGKTAGNLPRNQSQYLTMRDGVKIAVEVWLPADMPADEQVPTLIQATRYSRASLAYDLTLIDKLQIRLGLVDRRQADLVQLEPEAAWANEAGYAVVLVDARGSASSFGSRPIEWSPDEVADYGEVIEWIASQPWSNGRVGAWGTSYPGNTAELMASIGHPALKAVAPRFSDFDPLLGVGLPGGLRTDGFLEQWSEINAAFDNMPDYAKAVDADTDGELLLQALADHNNPNIAQTMRTIDYRNDPYGESGLTFVDISPYHLRGSIEEHAVPMQVWVSWLDAATADGALSRYLTIDNPQQIIIGPWSHGGGPSIDPFKPDPVQGEGSEAHLANLEAMKPQMEQVLAFFDCYLKESECTETASQITYYTLNSGTWQNTTVWPPEGFTTQHLYLAEGGALTPAVPMTEAAADEYAVDFSATTGQTNRWMAQMGIPVDYTTSRAGADEKLLTYTSLPLPTDTEITGSPIVTLFVASTTADSAFHVYLEDVAPDGQITYITEGVLRAVHHPVSQSQPPFVQLGPFHTFNREDASPLRPGEVTKITFKLYATSVLIEDGHSLRLSIAGADADTFARYPMEGSPMWTVHRSSAYPSHLALPMVER